MSTDVGVVEGILAILHGGRATGTNKFGLLLALLDLAHQALPSGAHPNTISVDELAYKYLELHWGHTRPFSQVSRSLSQTSQASSRANQPSSQANGGKEGPALSRTLTLVTSGNREARVLTEARRLQSYFPDPSTAAFKRLHQTVPEAALFASLKGIATELIRNPIDKLQKIAGKDVKLLYQYEAATRSLLLYEGVAVQLVRHGPLLRELIERRFVSQVARANHRIFSDLNHLHDHLFGQDRDMPSAGVRQALSSLQAGNCAYYGQPLTSRFALDHVIAWSRAKLSDISNFLAANAQLNSSKSDLLPGLSTIELWTEQLRKHHLQLQAASATFDYPYSRIGEETAIAIYDVLPSGTPVWDATSEGATVQELTEGNRSAILRKLEHSMRRWG